MREPGDMTPGDGWHLSAVDADDSSLSAMPFFPYVYRELHLSTVLQALPCFVNKLTFPHAFMWILPS